MVWKSSLRLAVETVILLIVTIMLANATGELLVPARLKSNRCRRTPLDEFNLYPVQLACTVGRLHFENGDNRFS